MKLPPSQRKSPPKRRGRKKAISISVQSEKQISAICTRFCLEGAFLTYRDVCRGLNAKYGTSLSLGMVYRMAHDGYRPRSLDIRRKLGLVKPRKPCTDWRGRALAAEAALERFRQRSRYLEPTTATHYGIWGEY